MLTKFTPSKINMAFRWKMVVLFFTVSFILLSASQARMHTFEGRQVSKQVNSIKAWLEERKYRVAMEYQYNRQGPVPGGPDPQHHRLPPSHQLISSSISNKYVLIFSFTGLSLFSFVLFPLIYVSVSELQILRKFLIYCPPR